MKKNPKMRERMKIETLTYPGDRIGYTTVRDVEWKRRIDECACVFLARKKDKTLTLLFHQISASHNVQSASDEREKTKNVVPGNKDLRRFQ